MNISKIEECRIREYNLEQVNIKKKREEDYRKVIEKKNSDRIVEDRIERNRRMDLDKGHNIDLEC